MSIQKHLDHIINNAIDHYPEGADNVPNEVEFALTGYTNTKDFDHKWNMGISRFGTLLKKFIKHRRIDKPIPSVMVTISESSKTNKTVVIPPDSGKARARIVGTGQDLVVKRFCMTNNPDKDTIYELKRRLHPNKTNDGAEALDFPEYGIRLRYSQESQLPDENKEQLQQVIRSNQIPKTYRYAQRYSIDCGKLPNSNTKLTVDFTSVKQGDGLSFSGAKIIGMCADKVKDRYEIEVDLSNSKDNVTVDDINNARQLLTDTLGYLLVEMQGGITLESYDEIGKNMKSYLTVCYDLWSNKLPNLAQKFKYPSQDMLTQAAPFFLAPAIWTLERDIVKSGSLFNNDPSVDEDDSSNPKYYFTDKADGFRCLMFVNSEGNCYLITKSGILLGERGASQQDILHIMPTGLKVDESNCILDGELIYAPSAAGDNYKYYFMSFDIIVFQGNAVTDSSFLKRYTLLERIKGHNDTIGLFAKSFKPYTPNIFKAYISNTNFQTTMENDQITAIQYYYNSIKYDLDGIVFQPAMDAYPVLSPSWQSVYKYKPMYLLTVDLELNYTKSLTKHSGFALHITNVDDNDQYGVFNASYYVNIKGRNIELKQSQHKCFANIINGVPKTQMGDVINRGDIVECRLEFRNSVLYWQPIRIRYDKHKPNSISVHHNIVKQMTEPVQLANLCVYKGGFGGELSFTKHNRWVSNGFIIKHASRIRGNIHLLDLACGNIKSGNAWMNIQKKLDRDNRGHVLKITGIDNCQDEATNMSTSYMYMSNLNNGNAPMFHTEDYDFFDVSMLEPLHKSENRKLRSKVALPENFHVITSIFSIYYAFVSEQTFRSLMANISRNLMIGGIFICSYMNSEYIESKMKTSIIEGSDSNKQIWKITKSSDDDMTAPFGRKVEVYINGLYGHKHHEYLVNLRHPTVVEIMKEYGLVRRDVEKFTDNSKTHVLTPDEKIWIGFHENICFTKEKIGSEFDVYDNWFNDVRPSVKTTVKTQVKVKPTAPVAPVAPAPVVVPVVVPSVTKSKLVGVKTKVKAKTKGKAPPNN
jgi:hypothetical protein